MSSVCWRTTAPTPTTSQSIQITSTLADGWVIFQCLTSHIILTQLETLFWYTLHQIADGQRELIRSHSVKNRHFIGNTSMDAGLALIMANHAKINKNDIVFDPFVGTGENLPFYILAHLHKSLGNTKCFNIFGSFCFRQSVGSMLAVWRLRLRSRYRLQHYPRERLVLYADFYFEFFLYY